MDELPPGIKIFGKKDSSCGRAGTARKHYTWGTHRLLPPEETLACVQPLMPVLGITRIANVTGLDIIGIPVVMVCRPNSRSISVSQGKGISLVAAKVSGLMESVESYHAERIISPLKLAAYEDIRYTHNVVDVDRLPRLSDSNFSPYKPVLWIEGRDLLNDRRAWVPYDTVYLNYTLPLPPGHGCFIASSNGLASGNHLLEAISHGICEVVERDAMTLWRLLNREAQDRTRIDLGTVHDPASRALLEKYEHADVEVGVWETTSDVGIPSFFCRIVQNKGWPANGYRPAAGSGCHPCREVALLRALTEAAQSRLTFISGARDDMPRSEYETFLSENMQDTWRTLLENRGAGRKFEAVPSRPGETFEQDLAWELERLASVGIEQVIVVDLSRPEFGVPVVRAVIPGLEGLDQSPKYVHGARARTRLQGGRAG